ncbi:MAG: glycoside hydrolase family 92 protein, partial [Verrucomicrobia bacterium]
AAATSALLAIGLFDIAGGAAREPVYEITSPIFDRVVIRLDQRWYPGKSFTIETKNNSRLNRYVQSTELNGESHRKPWFFHHQFAAGGRLTLHLGPEPKVDPKGQ